MQPSTERLNWEKKVKLKQIDEKPVLPKCIPAFYIYYSQTKCTQQKKIIPELLSEILYLFKLIK